VFHIPNHIHWAVFGSVYLSKYVKEKDFEVCGLNLRVASINLLIICLYRSPTGDYTYFLNQLELVLNKLYKVSTNIILCGDFNINFLESTSRITLLESLLAYNFEIIKPNPWITTGIKISCANKRKLFLTYRCSNDSGYKSYYKEYCKVLSSIITAAKKKYYDEQILNSNNKTKTTWNIVKSVTNNSRNPNKIVSMNIDNHPGSNPVTIANAFNTYFTSVASKLIKKLPMSNHPASKDPLINLNPNFKTPASPLIFKYTTTHEVNSIIHSLKTKDSYGYDEISSRIIKISAPFILSPLTHIFNKIFSTGIFPERLKLSEVKPLFKKNGSTTEFSNYRPISLLITFSKIIEKIMYKRLYNYLLKHDILVKEQFGFREGLSTDTATYAFLNSVLFSLDKRHLVGGLFCDLQKAFDCVNHRKLLEKLKFYGISGTANQLIKSYLTNRLQRVTINDNKHIKATSAWVSIEHGDPQGSVLGPLLFLI